MCGAPAIHQMDTDKNNHVKTQKTTLKFKPVLQRLLFNAAGYSLPTIVPTDGVGEGPVIQREQLEKGEDGTKHGAKVIRICLTEHPAEEDGKHEEEGEHEDDDGAHGREGPKASCHNGLQVLKEAEG